jgi:hypothetical protein
MGKKQVLDWLEHDMDELIEEGFQAMECIQRQGDILIVPELWGHAVLNTQDSVAVASEVKGSLFRIQLPRAWHDLSPNSGPPRPPRQQQQQQQAEKRPLKGAPLPRRGAGGAEGERDGRLPPPSSKGRSPPGLRPELRDHWEKERERRGRGLNMNH